MSLGAIRIVSQVQRRCAIFLNADIDTMLGIGTAIFMSHNAFVKNFVHSNTCAGCTCVRAKAVEIQDGTHSPCCIFCSKS
jgi:hypothetical protein